MRRGVLTVLMLALAAAAGMARAEADAEVDADARAALSGGFAGFYAFAPEPEYDPAYEPEYQGDSTRAGGVDYSAGDTPAEGLNPRSGLQLAGGDICISAIRAAERRYGIPNNLLLAIGLQEAGVRRNGKMTIWPWAVNSHGAGYTFSSREKAITFVRSELAAGKSSIDVGCLQVNLRWHPGAFSSMEQGFDPARNADYAARFLRGLYAETGDWSRAVGNYHSRTPRHHARYLAGVEANMAYVANLSPRAAAGRLPRSTTPATPRPAPANSAPQDESLDAILGEFAFGGATVGGEDITLAAMFDPGWGAREAGNMSIYSPHPIQPVLSNLASFSD